MYTQRTRNGVPRDYGGPGMTPHTMDQLGMTDKRRGWRRLDDKGESTIVYVVCHPQDGYRRTVYFPHGRCPFTQQQYRESLTSRLTEVEVPTKWAERMGAAYGDAGEMEQVVARINEIYPSGQVDGTSEVLS